jgi:hypothetical protein
MHEAGLKKRWKYHVTTRMRAAHRQGVWQFPRSTHFLNRYPCFSSLLNRLWGLTWYAQTGTMVRSAVMVRHAGLFCNRWRECHLARARKALRLPAPSNAEPPTPPPWAQRQEKLIGKDPLVCPRCHVPLLLVLVAFGPWDGLQQRWMQVHQPDGERRTGPRLLPVPPALRKPG